MNQTIYRDMCSRILTTILDEVKLLQQLLMLGYVPNRDQTDYMKTLAAMLQRTAERYDGTKL